MGRRVENLSFSHLRNRFPENFRRYEDQISLSLAPRTQKDRQEQIRVLKRCYEALTLDDLLPSTFSEALHFAIERSGLTLAQIARHTGVGAHALKQWSTGEILPQQEVSYSRIITLEACLGLSADTLVARLPHRRRERYERLKAKVEVVKSATASKKNSVATWPALAPTSRIEAQWQDLIRFKSDATREGATARNTWRIKPIESTGSRIAWSMLCDGMVCATAAVHWNFFGSYLGFLATPLPGKPNIDAAHADTLAWLAIPEYLTSYVSYLRRRAGNVTHYGIVTFLSNVRSHLRPETGYVWLHSELMDELTISHIELIQAKGSRETAWREYCKATYEKLIAFERHLKAQGPIKCSRDPRRRIEAILSDDFPLKQVVRIILDLEADEPPQAHHRDYVSWIRDVLMLKMIVSNPLRIAQFSIMRFRGDRPNLYETRDGAWRVRFEPSDFKNQNGAAFEAYDVAVEQSVWPWIRRYFSESRPSLIDADSDYVFLPTVKGPNRGAGSTRLGYDAAGNWSGDCMAARIKAVTARYTTEKGFGPHAFRHIIATDHLKRHPADYLTVAQLLHDKLETVMKAYAHLKADTGLRTLHAGVAQATEELNVAARKRS